MGGKGQAEGWGVKANLIMFFLPGGGLQIWTYKQDGGGGGGVGGEGSCCKGKFLQFFFFNSPPQI